jgi:hypothetical protein
MAWRSTASRLAADAAGRGHSVWVLRLDDLAYLKGTYAVLSFTPGSGRHRKPDPGSERLWATAVALISSTGSLLISYVVFGRYRQP